MYRSNRSVILAAVKPTAEELFGPAGTPRVVVVGAGFGGIAAGVKLKRAGIDTFTIYESSLGVGGTWWDNTYPGAEVDVGSHLYCFSFKPHDWTRTHAKQPELQKYLEETVDEYGLRPHLRLGVTVSRRRGTTTATSGRSDFDDGTVDECHVLVSGVGFLNVPRYPDWPGLDDFAGPKFHTARWEHQHDLTGKVVAVVGTGSSATQVVPAIAADRAAALRVPARAGLGRAQGRARLHRRGARGVRQAVAAPAGALAAASTCWRRACGAGTLYRPGTKTNEARRQFCLRLHRPPVRRPPRPARGGHADVPLSRQAAGLRQHVLSRAQEGQRRARAAGGRVGDPHRHRRRDGVERAVDVIVMATGFQPANYLARLPRRRPRRPDAAGALGGRAARRSSASPCPRSRTSSCSTGRAPTAARS